MYNMNGLDDFITLIVVAFGVVQIILLVKIWRMTNDVRKLKAELLRNNPSNEAAILFLKGDKEAAHNKLQESFLQDVVIASNSTWTSNPGDDYRVGFEKIKVKYNSGFDKIGLGHPDYSLYDELDKVKL